LLRVLRHDFDLTPFGETIVKWIWRAAVAFCAGFGSFAAHSKELLPPPPRTTPEIPPTVEITSFSTATTRRIWDQWLEGTVAPVGNLDESGFRTRLWLAFGRYDYPIRGEDADVPFSDFGLPWLNEFGKISGRYQEGQFLFGYEYVSDRFSLLGLIGAGVQHHGLSQPDPENPVRGTRWGFTVAAELDAHPTERTMFFGFASYSTAFTSVFVDARPGYLLTGHLNIADLIVAEDVYLGPHGIYEYNKREFNYKAGIHLTLSEMGPFHTTIAGGYAYDQFNKSGAYGLIETSVRF
jgi:hypothetical protein